MGIGKTEGVRIRKKQKKRMIDGRTIEERIKSGRRKVRRETDEVVGGEGDQSRLLLSVKSAK